MGKYSLENFEKYKVLRLRPEENETAAHAKGTRQFKSVRILLGDETPQLNEPSLVIVDVTKADEKCFIKLENDIRALVARYHGNEYLLGVMINPRQDMDITKRRRLWEVTAHAALPRRYYVPVTDGDQLDYMLKRGLASGLYVPVSDNILDVCEAFAENNAQQLYKQMPVLVSFAEEGTMLGKHAERWHAQAVENATANVGWCIALRRMMTPPQITSGGFMPLRFWWTNRGPAYCHETTHVRLRLTNQEAVVYLNLSDRPSYIHLADRVHNEIIRVPSMAPGKYRLEFGLFTEAGRMMQLAHNDRTSDGYYYAGEVEVDNIPRPEFSDIWDDYFPDGYYPLEDPKVPG